MAEIFISYSHADRDKTQQLTELLKEAYDVWYDPELKGGDTWWKRIIEEIHQCKFFIFLISPESLKSKYCVAEIDEARRNGKKIIPIRVRIGGELSKDLNELQIIDISQSLNLSGLNQIYSALIRTSQFLSLSLEEKQQRVDLSLLTNLWALITSSFRANLITQISDKKVLNDLIVDHLWTYLFHRSKPENKFINIELEAAFEDMDQSCDQIQTMLLRKYETTRIQGMTYRILNDDRESQKAQADVLEGLGDWIKNHQNLTQTIKHIYPDFDFELAEKNQQKFDELRSQFLGLVKLQTEYSRFIGKIPADIEEYSNLIVKIQFVCETIASYDRECPEDCLKLDISSLRNKNQAAILEENCRYYLLFIARIRLIPIFNFQNPLNEQQWNYVEAKNRNALQDAVTSVQRILEREKPLFARDENISKIFLHD